MSKILKFKQKDNNPEREVDGSAVRNYVYSKIDFNLPEFIYEEIDEIIGGVWNSTPDSGILYSNDLIIALEALKNKNILLSYEQKNRIVEFIIEYLDKKELLIKYEN